MTLLRKLSATFAAGILAALAFALPADAHAASNCSAYVYAGTQTNLCHDFPGDTDRDCPQIGHPVTLVPGIDPWRLSAGGSSRTGCEHLPPYVPPVKVSHSPSASPSPVTSPSPSTSVSASSSASAGPVGSGTHRGPSASVSSGAPALAVTGAPVLGFALVGASTALFGIAVYILTRRRIRRFTS